MQLCPARSRGCAGWPCSARYCGVAQSRCSMVSQPGRRAVGDADGQVDVLVDQVDLAVFQQQLHVHRRVTAQELGHVRMDHRAAHRLGHRQPDDTGRCLVELTADLQHRPGGANHVAATPIDLLPRLRQTQLAGAAIEQAGAQGLLQARHAATGGRRGQTQLAGRRRKAAALHHPHEDGHLAEQWQGKIYAHSAKFLWREGGLSPLRALFRMRTFLVLQE
jgi:hypothetical protein